MSNYLVIIECDRCHQLIKGAQTPDSTAGFYLMSEYWAKFADATPEEKRICDACMWKSPKYIEVYGNIGPAFKE